MLVLPQNGHACLVHAPEDCFVGHEWITRSLRLLNRAHNIVEFRSHRSQNLFNDHNILHFLTMNPHFVGFSNGLSKILIHGFPYLHVEHLKFLSKSLSLCALHSCRPLVLLLQKVLNALCCIFVQNGL